MQLTSLGKSPLKVSRLCLGTMMFGDQTPLEDARAIVADAHEKGCNFIDTADVVHPGQVRGDGGSNPQGSTPALGFGQQGR